MLRTYSHTGSSVSTKYMITKQNTLKEINKDVYQPEIKGTLRMCPFRNPIPLQSEFGSLTLQHIPCTSQCALMKLTPIADEKISVDFKCANQPHSIHCVIEPLTPKSPLTIN